MLYYITSLFGRKGPKESLQDLITGIRRMSAAESRGAVPENANEREFHAYPGVDLR